MNEAMAMPRPNMEMQMGLFPSIPGRCMCQGEIRRLEGRIELLERQIRMLDRRVSVLDSHLPRPRPFNANMNMEASMPNEYPQTGNYML